MTRSCSIIRYFVFLSGVFLLFASVNLLSPFPAQAQESVEDILDSLEPPASVQETPQGATDAESAPVVKEKRGNVETRSDLEKIPEAYFIEAERFQGYCEGNSDLSGHYDCSCMASEYLKQRIERGPSVYGTAILEDIMTEKCIDVTGAAGEYYGSCLGMGVMAPPNVSVEEFCTCFANTYAKLFKRHRLRPSFDTSVKLQTQARISCSN